MNITKNSLLTFGTFASVFGIGFLLSILIARNLGPDGQGVFSLFFVTAMYFTTFGNLGLPNANIFFTGRKANIEDIIGNVLVFFTIACVVLLGIFTLLSERLMLDKEYIIKYVYILIPLILFNVLALSVYQSKKLFYDYNCFVLLRPLTFLIFVGYLKFFGEFDIINTILAFIASFLAVDILQIVLSKRTGFKKISFNRGLLKESLKYGIKGHMGNMLQFFNYRLDFYFIVLFVGDEQLGFYSVAIAFSEVLMIIPRSISLVIFPEISEKESETEIRLLTERACRLTLMFTLLSGVVFYFACEYLIPFFYAGKFNSSIEPLIILLPGVVALSVGNILAHNLLGRKFPVFASIASGCGLVVTVVLDLILIPEYGIWGAAVASSLSYSCTAIVFVFFYRKKTEFNFSDLLIIKKEDLVYILKMISKLLGKK
ncbi:MAG: flippase [bacterium]|nr:flippase [bacterium]